MSYTLQELREDVRRLLSLDAYPRVVEDGYTQQTSAFSLPSQQSLEAVTTKTFSGLDASKTYRLHAWYSTTCRPVSGSSDHRYQGAMTLSGEAGGRGLSLCYAGNDYGVPVSGSAVWEFTGDTSKTLDACVYSYSASGTGRVYYRNLSWRLEEIA